MSRPGQLVSKVARRITDRPAETIRQRPSTTTHRNLRGITRGTRAQLHPAIGKPEDREAVRQQSMGSRPARNAAQLWGNRQELQEEAGAADIYHFRAATCLAA